MSLLLKALEKAAASRQQATKAQQQKPQTSPLSFENQEPNGNPRPTPTNQQNSAAHIINAGSRTKNTQTPMVTKSRQRISLVIAISMLLISISAYYGYQMMRLPQHTPGQYTGSTPTITAPQPTIDSRVVNASPDQITTTALIAENTHSPNTSNPLSVNSTITAVTPTNTPELIDSRRTTSPTPAERPLDMNNRTIKISTGTAEAVSDQRLISAYNALQSGQLETARNLYTTAFRNDSKNLSAILGLAIIAAQQKNTQEASAYYFSALELEPRNPYAQAGLIALIGRADPQAAESRLKLLIGRGSYPALHFILGNLYADQSRWSEAQQSYFQAHQLEPDHPDYAYNLAVGLEHISQSKLAINFYRKALDLARQKGHAEFNQNQVRDRLQQLSSVAD